MRAGPGDVETVRGGAAALISLNYKTDNRRREHLDTVTATQSHLTHLFPGQNVAARQEFPPPKVHIIASKQNRQHCIEEGGQRAAAARISELPRGFSCRQFSAALTAATAGPSSFSVQLSFYRRRLPVV